MCTISGLKNLKTRQYAEGKTSVTRMTASVIKQDPDTEKFQNNTVY